MIRGLLYYAYAQNIWQKEFGYNIADAPRSILQYLTVLSYIYR